MTADDPLIDLIADAIVDADTLSGDLTPAARAVYDAIAATGRLLPARTETHVRHASRGTNGEIQVIWGSGDEAAESAARDAKEHGTEHVTQRQYATDWEAVDDHA